MDWSTLVAAKPGASSSAVVESGASSLSPTVASSEPPHAIASPATVPAEPSGKPKHRLHTKAALRMQGLGPLHEDACCMTIEAQVGQLSWHELSVQASILAQAPMQGLNRDRAAAMFQQALRLQSEAGESPSALCYLLQELQLMRVAWHV